MLNVVPLRHIFRTEIIQFGNLAIEKAYQNAFKINNKYRHV